MMNDTEQNNPEIGEEAKRKRREKAKQRAEEEKADEDLVPIQNDVQKAKKKAISNIGTKNLKQLRLESAKIMQARDKRYVEAKKQPKDRLAMEVAVNTNAFIEKNVIRTVKSETKQAISDPAFLKYIETLVASKSQEKIDEIGNRSCKNIR